MTSNRDPKDIVTPFAFRVAPDLLGRPLAGPFRRAAAMLVDLLLLALLLLVREISTTLLGLVVAWILFRVSSPSAEDGVTGPVARPLVRVCAFVVLFATVTLFLGSCFGILGGDGDSRRRASRVPVEGGSEAVGLGEAMGMLGTVARLAAADDSATAQRAADRFAEALVRSGVEPADRREALGELLRPSEAPWREAVARTALARADSIERVERVDSIERVERVDVPEAAEIREEVSRRTAEARRLSARQDEAGDRGRRTGILGFLRRIAEDLGIGIGWAGAYFTLFTVLLRGGTPGKRLLGIRVVRLSGEPIGWWAAFSRFGGYAAGFATGLLGFLQLFWDANRQGVHDKIVGTVVVRTSGHAAEAAARLARMRAARREAAP